MSANHWKRDLPIITLATFMLLGAGPCGGEEEIKSTLDSGQGADSASKADSGSTADSAS